MVRLNKYLASCGVAARRKCDELIAQGQVSVNGTIERRLGTKVAVGSDQVEFLDKRVEPIQSFHYILLHKPRGVVSTAKDERHRKTVIDIINLRDRVFPVGRLDRDTSGVLILTNDGEVSYRLTHPKYEVSKTYDVHLDSDLAENDKKKLQVGIELEEGVTSAAVVSWTEPGSKASVRITIHQGWNRQVRRMFETLGYKVRRLKRVEFAGLTVEGLRPGEWRKLRRREIEHLKRIGYGNQG